MMQGLSGIISRGFYETGKHTKRTGKNIIAEAFPSFRGSRQDGPPSGKALWRIGGEGLSCRWIHDCAKEMTLSEMQHVVKKAHLTFDDAEHMLKSRALLHGPAGSVLAKTAFGIDDEEIRGAIYYHTTGRVGMTLLERIVFLADYIEPNRDFSGVQDLRLLAEKDLDQAVLAAYDSTISHLIDQGAYIYGLTFLGRNDMVEKQEKSGR